MTPARPTWRGTGGAANAGAARIEAAGSGVIRGKREDP